MYYVYVFKSLRTDKRYVGYTSKLPELRLQEHNDGKSKWTFGHRPFKLVYSESYDNKTTAIKREKFLKTGDGRKLIDSLVFLR